MKKNSYSLDKNILTIRTECGDYGFKIDGEMELANAERIAELMVGEMEKIEKKFQGVKENSNPYAKLLLSNLNISNKYIQLEHEYNRLFKRNEKMKAFYQGRYQSGDDFKQERQPDPPLHGANSSDDLKGGNDISEKEVLGEHRLKEPVRDLPEEETRNDSMISSTQTAVPPESETVTEPQAKLPEETETQSLDNLLTESLEVIQTGSLEEVKTESLEVLQTESSEKLQTEALELLQTESLEELQMELLEDTDTEQQPATQAAAQNSNLDRDGATEPEQGHAAPPATDPVLPGTPTVPAFANLKINRRRETHNFFTKSAGTGSDKFQLPALNFLKRGNGEIEIDHEAIRRDAELLEQKLGYFGITGEVMEVSPGPVITTFEYKPDPGIKISKIVNLADDLALALSALSIRIVAPIPGKDVIGIEIPNIKKSLVPFIDIVNSDDFINSDSKLPICLGKDIIGNPVVVELDKMPHLLIAGATGTGKSVGLNAMITSILYKSPPDKVNFIMIDPKRIELSMFNDIPHLLTPVITDMKKANLALQWVVREMERRYEILAKLQVRNIEQYNEKIKTMDLTELDRDRDDSFEEFSYIVIIIDELADLMMTAAKDIEFSLTRIAQMARAAGIHLVLATQRPSVDVLTGIIKANFPTRISFQVSSKTDSRTIIDSNGAETLLGRGDMLFVPPGTARLTRVHGTYLSEEELITITDFLKTQKKPEYIFDVTAESNTEPAVEICDDEYDEKYQAALEFVLVTRQASISSVQRALRVGYNRAARIIDLMEKRGIVGPPDGVKPRRVLVDRME